MKYSPYIFGILICEATLLKGVEEPLNGQYLLRLIVHFEVFFLLISITISSLFMLGMHSIHNW